MPAQSDIARRAAAIEKEFETRTTRMAALMKGEFDADDATEVSNKEMHEIIRRNWSDPEWRIKTSQRMGPVALYKTALEAFGRKLDGTPSIDSHPDALAAEPTETQLKEPQPPKEPAPKAPDVFPFQGPPAQTPQPVPVMPMPMPQPGMPGMPGPPMPPPPMPGMPVPPPPLPIGPT